MKSKKILCAAVAVALTMGVSGAVFTGCFSTNNEEDVKQVVAEVNCAESIKSEFGAECSSAVATTKILKRDLVAGFMNYGSTYLQSGMTSSQAYDTIVDGLVDNAVLNQYAQVYLLKHKTETNEISLETYNSKESEVEKIKYLLGEEAVKKADYSFNSSINSSLDSYEKQYLSEENGYTGSGSRATPTGIDTLKEDYVPEKYGIYTGYKNYFLSDAGEDYEPVENSNKTSRRKAYARFIGNLKRNYLISAKDVDTTDIMQISYIQSVYLSALKEAVVDQFYEVFEKKQETIVSETDENGVYTYVEAQYNGLDGEYTKQEKKYSKVSDFESSLSTMSDTSFILYSPSTTEDTAETEVEGKTTRGTYGYVYNILLPFSTMQSVRLTELQKFRDADPAQITESKYLYDRNEILKQITTTDQRSAWFNGTTDYSFDASGKELSYYNGGKDYRKYLFFENNLLKSGENGKYEKLEKYDGRYSYNGKVNKNKNGSYSLIPDKLTIDGMLSEFSAYINYVLGKDPATENAAVVHAGDTLAGGTDSAAFGAYYSTHAAEGEEPDFTKAGEDTEIDYSLLVYATGQVDFGADAKTGDIDMFTEDSARYKVMSAVNELQYAYTTDTSVLSQYIGYSVSAYDTSYIKEFEYAAQRALRMGVGAFKVCAGDYGWHLIYVTDTFDVEGGEVYKGLSWTKDRVEAEGTFENRFYNWVKDSAISKETGKKRSEVVKAYNNDESVTINKKTYKDLAGD